MSPQWMISATCRLSSIRTARVVFGTWPCVSLTTPINIVVFSGERVIRRTWKAVVQASLLDALLFRNHVRCDLGAHYRDRRRHWALHVALSPAVLRSTALYARRGADPLSVEDNRRRIDRAVAGPGRCVREQS